MPLPVVTVAKGGLPVSDAGSSPFAFPVVEAANGIGLPVTKVTGGGAAMAVAYVGGGGGGGGGSATAVRILSASRAGIASAVVVTGGGLAQIISGIGAVYG